jgi:hypothetical protein
VLGAPTKTVVSRLKRDQGRPGNYRWKGQLRGAMPGQPRPRWRLLDTGR